MVMETEKNKISINQELGSKKDIFQVENDIIVNDIKPDVLSIIDTDGILCINKKEISNGKIKLEGEVNSFIIYLADDENSTVRSLNTCLNFNEVIDIENYNENMNINVCCSLKNIEAKIINGRKIGLKATIEVQSNFYLTSDFETVCNIDSIENMQVLKNTQQIVSCLGRGKTKVNAKDTIAIDEIDDIAEIMNVELNVIGKETKTSYNKVLVKAEAEVKILYLTEDNRVNSANTRIPIMGFIDMQDINDECIIGVSNQINNIVIKPNTGDDHSIYIEAEIEFCIEAFENKQIDIIEDLYSTVANAEANLKDINSMTEKDNIHSEHTIKENMQFDDLGNNTIYFTNIKPNILKEDVRMGKVIYEGEVVLKILYSNNEKMDVRTLNIPFTTEIVSNKITNNALINKEILIKDENIVLLNDKIDVNICLEFNLNIEEYKDIKLIENINLDNTMEKNPYSMVIYFVKPGDTLWKIAKKFRSTISDIATVNEIDDVNNIKTGKQLYIPKPIRCNG